MSDKNATEPELDEEPDHRAQSEEEATEPVADKLQPPRGFEPL